MKQRIYTRTKLSSDTSMITSSSTEEYGLIAFIIYALVPPFVFLFNGENEHRIHAILHTIFWGGLCYFIFSHFSETKSWYLLLGMVIYAFLCYGIMQMIEFSNKIEELSEQGEE